MSDIFFTDRHRQGPHPAPNAPVRSRRAPYVHLTERERITRMRLILAILLLVLLLGALPTWPYSTGWGYYPSGGIGLILIIILVALVAKPGR